MKNIEVHKTPTGYCLTHSRGVKALVVALSVGFFALGVLLSGLIMLVPSLPLLLKIPLAATAVFGSSVLLPALVLTLAFGIRWTVDEEGAHCCLFHRKVRSISWRSARSCGISPYVTGGKRLAFYVSSDPELNQEKDPQNTVYVGLYKKSAEAIRETELILFCRAHILGARDEDA